MTIFRFLRYFSFTIAYLLLTIISNAYAININTKAICNSESTSSNYSFQVIPTFEYGYPTIREYKFSSTIERYIIKSGVTVLPWYASDKNIVSAKSENVQGIQLGSSIISLKDKSATEEVITRHTDRSAFYVFDTDYAFLTSDYDSNRIKLVNLKDDTILYTKNRIYTKVQLIEFFKNAFKAINIDFVYPQNELDVLDKKIKANEKEVISTKLISDENEWNSIYTRDICVYINKGTKLDDPLISVVPDTRTAYSYNQVLNEMRFKSNIEEVLINENYKVLLTAIPKEKETTIRKIKAKEDKSFFKNKDGIDLLSNEIELYESFDSYMNTKASILIITNFTNRTLKIYSSVDNNLIISFKFNKIFTTQGDQGEGQLLIDALKALDINSHIKK